ncbi:MAG: ABC transporter permease, partial [Gemmataceae bacterium]
MLPVARMLVPAQFSKQPGRTILIILSIALGVATLVATQSLKRGITQGKKDPFARGDLLVLNGRAGVPVALADELAQTGIPGVAGVHALVIGRALVETEGNPTRPVFVVGWSRGNSGGQVVPDLANLRKQVVEQGLSLEVATSLNPLLLLSKTPVVAGQALGLLGKPFTMRAGAGKLECLAAGAIRPNSQGGDSRLAPVLGQVVAMGAIQAGGLIYPERPGTVSRLDLVLDPGTDREKVRAALAQKLGDRAEVHTVEEEESLVGDVTSGLELGFQVGGLGSLIVGLFLVYNVMSVGVEERRRFIGILRCAGGTRGQVAGLFLQEAACLGLAGSLLGIPLGLGIARLVVGPMGNALEEVLGRPTGEAAINLGWSNALLAVTAGVLTALVAALIPACRASLEAPAGVVRQSGAGGSRYWLRSSLPILMLVA